MKGKTGIWRVLAILYMALLALFCLFDGLQTIEFAREHSPVYGLVVLMSLAGIFAVLTTIALLAKWPFINIAYGAFSIAWAAALYVETSTFIVMCASDTQRALSLSGLVVIPILLGHLLLKKSRRTMQAY